MLYRDVVMSVSHSQIIDTLQDEHCFEKLTIPSHGCMVVLKLLIMRNNAEIPRSSHCHNPHGAKYSGAHCPSCIISTICCVGPALL